MAQRGLGRNPFPGVVCEHFLYQVETILADVGEELPEGGGWARDKLNVVRE